MKTLFLITARGGSKSVPGKNLRKIAGISLVGFKARSALKSRYCLRLIISSENREIQEDARKYGAEVPFIRPEELATDTASSTDVILHTMTWIENETKESYDAVMLLEPSSPFARPFDYDNAVEIMLKYDANAVVGVRRVEVSSIYVGQLDEQGRITQIVDQMKKMRVGRRQDMELEFTPNGALYLFKWEYFKKHKDIYFDRERTYGYPMPREYSIEIDEPIDLKWAEFLVENRHVDISFWK